MPRTKKGEKITWREFGKRWKKGIEGITIVQQTESQLLGYLMVLIGVSWGIVVACLLRTWWLVVVLVGSLIISGMSAVGMLQKFWVLKNLQKLTKEVEYEN
jgi:hypothetical protein